MFQILRNKSFHHFVGVDKENDELEFYYPDEDAEADVRGEASAEKNYDENKEQQARSKNKKKGNSS